MTTHHFFQIAIDGPVAAGKGTIAKLLASRLNYLYVDTGAMYRAATLLFLQHHLTIDAAHQDQLVAVLQAADFALTNVLEEGILLTQVTLNGQDVSAELRSQAVNCAVSQTATLPAIRRLLVQKQQALAATNNVVMEGRDIGTVVLPGAQLKLYLTADLDERARRRLAQLKDTDPQLTLATVKQQIADRDHQDMTRAIDPLVKTADAIELDTTNLNIGQVVDQLVALVKEKVLT